MNNLFLLLIIFTTCCVYWFFYKLKKGTVKKNRGLQILESELLDKYGKRATVVIFSTTFCSECRAAKALISDCTSILSDISYIQIDAESSLELVRKVDIRSTPTTIFLDKAGFEVARATGAPKRGQLIKVIASLQLLLQITRRKYLQK